MQLKSVHVSEGKQARDVRAADSESEPILAQDALRQNLQRQEIPSLYGLRGVAALTIVCWHFAEPFAWRRWFPGPYAVTLFFELSGLLITILLLREMERTGSLNLAAFYRRRALRLFPAFYVTWALCRFVRAFPGEWFHFFYLGDYYTAVTQHFSAMTPAWSLGVEEKFYLLWPVLLLKIPIQRLRSILIAVLVIEPIYRFVLIRLGFRQYTNFAFDTHLDALVLGCFLAIAVWEGAKVPRWIAHPFTPAAALLGLFVLQAIPDLVAYLLLVLLISVIARPPSVLKHPALRFLGFLSYSLYLSHMYASTTIWTLIFRDEEEYSKSFVFASRLVLALCFAVVLHMVVERPLLLRKWRVTERGRA